MPGRGRPEGLTLQPHYLRQWRDYRGLTLAEVGQKMGITPSALSRVETFQTPWNQIHMQQLSEIYDVLIPDLLFTNPLWQTQANQFGLVGFQQPTVVVGMKRQRPPTPLEKLISTVSKLRLPEEIDSVRRFTEAVIARREKLPKL